MTKAVSVGNYRFLADNYLLNNLDIINKEAIPKNWDALFILFGKEGTGKSTLATQIGLYLDPKFSLKNIVFTPSQFEKAIKECPPESSIIWDEAITGANISLHASEISQSIIQKLTQIRKKRLKIILCFPYLYMLNKYFISRCVASVYIYAKGFDKRGYAFFYSNNKTENLYNLMKEKYRYNYKIAISKAYKDFYFMFPSTFCAEVEDYENKKDSAIQDNVKESKKNLWKTRLGTVLNYISKEHNVTVTEIAKHLNMTPENLYRLTNKDKNK